MPQSIRIQLDDTITELLEVSDLGSGLVRLEATPLAAPRPLYRGDTVEVEVAVASPNTVRFVRVVEQAPLHHQTWIVSRSFPDSEDYGRFVGEIEAAGGSAESLLGGMLHVHLPINSLFEADAALDRALGQHARRTEPFRSRLRRWLTGRPYERPDWPAA